MAKVQAVDGITLRMADAINEARDAFWAVIAAKYPEITTGDFPPDAELDFAGAMVDAVQIWVDGNTP